MVREGGEVLVCATNGSIVPLETRATGGRGSRGTGMVSPESAWGPAKALERGSHLSWTGKMNRVSRQKNREGTFQAGEDVMCRA